jgi:hypothetical protein
MPHSTVSSDAPRPNGVDRAAINRANAQKSTGPRTEAGKRRSSLNALRHGLTGHTIVLPAEDHATYLRHSQSFLDDCRPKGAIEIQMVQSLIDASWQLNRANAIETNLLSLGITENENLVHANHPDAETALAMALGFREHNRAFAQISIYRQRLTRQFENTLAQLRQIQAERREDEERQLDEAAKILKMHQDEQLSDRSALNNQAPCTPAPYNPADDGFVFSNDEIETFIRRRDRAGLAEDHDLASCA